MTDDLTVARDEHGVVRVFALNLDEGAATPWTEGDGAAMAEALGLGGLDPKYVEVVRPQEMKPMTLSDYLVEGIGLPREEVSGARSRLDALSGHVLIVLSGAFGGREATLAPTPVLTHIGTFREPAPVPSFDRLSLESAKGALDGAGPAGSVDGKGRSWILALLIGAAVLIALVLVLMN
ncbi:hypothetical protein [Ovoidimarina sediminis]|uniref:hypothetical protein n=1 Tax=Ovoidimarina sediminis TaxID=3079856 RepID=UPI002909C4A5|nr:hypothetical protein [Rhodophyticola sp. MJ-SS7]MDU8943501.1 hypothetical protein [Rhodophyticola sp. MJ-SS7]